MTERDSLSFILFALPSAAEGVARLYDFGGTLTEFNTSLTPEEADSIALYSDVVQVGQDMRRVLSTHSDEVVKA